MSHRYFFSSTASKTFDFTLAWNVRWLLARMELSLRQKKRYLRAVGAEKTSASASWHLQLLTQGLGPIRGHLRMTKSTILYHSLPFVYSLHQWYTNSINKTPMCCRIKSYYSFQKWWSKKNKLLWNTFWELHNSLPVGELEIGQNNFEQKSGRQPDEIKMLILFTIF